MPQGHRAGRSRRLHVVNGNGWRESAEIQRLAAAPGQSAGSLPAPDVQGVLSAVTAVRRRAHLKAVRLHEYGGPENLKYEDHVPAPVLAANSVLVESAAASVNPIDWKVRSGAR